MRHVDRVTVKGSKQPMDLYTCDMDPELISKSRIMNKKIDANMDKRIIRVVARHKKQDRLNQIIKNKIQISNLLEKDQELIDMRKPFNYRFMDTWHEAVGYYLDGYWEEARVKFEETEVFFKNLIHILILFLLNYVYQNGNLYFLEHSLHKLLRIGNKKGGRSLRWPMQNPY